MQNGISLELTNTRRPAGGGAGDVTPPGTVTDLYLVGSNGTDDALLATNSVPSDDLGLGGDPAAYEIRRSAILINTEGKWAAAEPVSGGWQPEINGAGAYGEYYLIGLTPGSHWYHIRWKDAAGNAGAISNGVALTLA